MRLQFKRKLSKEAMKKAIYTQSVDNSNWPTLESFGLEISSYSNFENYRRRIKLIEKNWLIIFLRIAFLLLSLAVFGIFFYSEPLFYLFALIFLSTSGFGLCSKEGFIFESICNSVSLGEYSQLKDYEKKIRLEVSLFEMIFSKYCIGRLNWFYDWMYETKIGEESMLSVAELNRMIELVKSINDIFLSKPICLKKYIAYSKYCRRWYFIKTFKKSSSHMMLYRRVLESAQYANDGLVPAENFLMMFSQSLEKLDESDFKKL
jgi:hypothetical protein